MGNVYPRGSGISQKEREKENHTPLARNSKLSNYLLFERGKIHSYERHEGKRAREKIVFVARGFACRQIFYRQSKVFPRRDDTYTHSAH